LRKNPPATQPEGFFIIYTGLNENFSEDFYLPTQLLHLQSIEKAKLSQGSGAKSRI